MQHLHELNKTKFTEIFNGKPFLITKHDPLIEIGDDLIITEQGTRNQIVRRVSHIETEGLFKGYCVIGLAMPGVTKIQAARGIPDDVEEILPRFSPAEKEATNSDITEV